jgi:hypothetical protein
MSLKIESPMLAIHDANKGANTVMAEHILPLMAQAAHP